MPFAWMTLSSTQRCSSKRLTIGSPFGLRFDQSRVFVAAPASGVSAAAGATALAIAAPAAAASEPDCRKARRSMTVLPCLIFVVGLAQRSGPTESIPFDDLLVCPIGIRTIIMTSGLARDDKQGGAIAIGWFPP